VDPGDHVEAPDQVGGHERLVDDLLVELVREVGVQGAAVDRPLAGAGHQAHPRHGLLAAAGGGRGGDRRRAGRRVGAGGALGGVSDARLVDLVGLLGGLLVVVCHVGGVSHESSFVSSA
jgi:hypothetical protein